MDMMDYREILKIDTSDCEKQKLCMNCAKNLLGFFDEYPRYIPHLQSESFLQFCNTVGCLATEFQKSDSPCEFDFCISYIVSQKDFKTFLFAYIALVSVLSQDDYLFARNKMIEVLKKAFNSTHIMYDIIESGCEFYILPKGAAELDKALVSEPLIWLLKFPKTRAIMENVLRQYSNPRYTDEVADDLRKTLETFFQEYLNNDKTLENNKAGMFSEIKQKSADNTLPKLYSQVINTYSIFNNETSKHHAEKINPKLLEFLLYQTGLLIRAVITLDD